MVKAAPGIMKPGRVVIVLSGKYAGKKAVVVKTCEEGTESKKFSHALVAGIETHARKVTKSMSAKKVERRTKMKAFIKAVNYTHLLPTRYTVDEAALGLSEHVDAKTTTGKGPRKEARKAIQEKLHEKYNNQYTTNGVLSRKQQSLQFFFTKLRF